MILYLNYVRHAVDDIVLNILDTAPPHLSVRQISALIQASDLIYRNAGESDQSNNTVKWDILITF